jgi:hypothetical protein
MRLKPVGRKEAADELVAGERHDLGALVAFGAVVLPFEGDAGMIEGDDRTESPPRKLAELLANAAPGIQYSEHLEGDGAAIFAEACKLGAEGVVSKQLGASLSIGAVQGLAQEQEPAAPDGDEP